MPCASPRTTATVRRAASPLPSNRQARIAVEVPRRSGHPPLHPTTVEALDRYAQTREWLCPKPRSRAFFLSVTGTALNRSEVSKTLRGITTALGLRTATVHPRAHDLRHSFAVRTLIG